MVSQAALSPAELDSLIRAHSEFGRRVFVLEAGGNRVWVKRGEKNFINGFQRVFAGLSGARAGSLEGELRAMAAVARRGAVVPRVLAVSQDYVALSDVGPSLEFLMRGASPEERLALARRGAEALSALHKAGGWHGNPRLRDVTLGERGVGFIDFENMGKRLPLPWRQAVDVWHYAQSCARFDRAGGLTRAALAAYEGAEVRGRLKMLAWGCLPLYIVLRPFLRFQRREVMQAVVCERELLRMEKAHG